MANTFIQALGTGTPPKRRRPRVASVRAKTVVGDGNDHSSIFGGTLEFIVLNDLDNDEDSQQVILEQIISIIIYNNTTNDANKPKIVLPIHNIRIDKNVLNGKYDSFSIDILRHQFEEIPSFQITDIMIIYESESVQVHTEITVTKV